MLSRRKNLADARSGAEISISGAGRIITILYGLIKIHIRRHWLRHQAKALGLACDTPSLVPRSAKAGKRLGKHWETGVNLNPLTYRDSLGVIDDLGPPRAVSVESGRSREHLWLG